MLALQKKIKQILNASNLIDFVPKVDNHIHTNFTDGTLSVEQIVNEALSKELESISITEHTSIGSRDWFSDLVDQVKSFSKILDISIGTEVRINDFNGGITIDPDVRRNSDIIVASVHRFPNNQGHKMSFLESSKLDTPIIELKLMLGVIRNRSCHVVGHPFGMSLIRHKIMPATKLVDELIGEAVDHGVALEINSKYHQDFFFEYYVQRLVASDALVSIGSDVHYSGEIGTCFKKIRSLLDVKKT